jgi:hypothetical protein
VARLAAVEDLQWQAAAGRRLVIPVAAVTRRLVAATATAGNSNSSHNQSRASSISLIGLARQKSKNR